MVARLGAPRCRSVPGGLAQRAELAGRQDSAAPAIPAVLLADGALRAAAVPPAPGEMACMG